VGICSEPGGPCVCGVGWSWYYGVMVDRNAYNQDGPLLLVQKRFVVGVGSSVLNKVSVRKFICGLGSVALKWCQGYDREANDWVGHGPRGRTG